MKILQQLPELPQEWFRGPLEDKSRLVRSGAESAERSITWRLKQLKETAPEEIAVLSWEDSVDVATAYMDMLEYITGRFSELDVAVGVKTSNSISGGTHYSSYYSRSGENTLNPDDFMNVCDVEVDGGPHFLTTGRDGTKHDIALADYYLDWFGEDEDLYHIADCILDDPLVFIYTPEVDLWDSIFDLDYNEYSGHDCFDFYDKIEDKPTYKLKKIMPDYEKFFQVDEQHKLQPEDYTDDLLERIMKIIFPQETFHVETRNGMPFIWDDSGKEYFPGGVMEFVEDSAREKVYWYFPDEEDGDPWVPFT